MRNPAPLGFRQLGRADIEVAVDLERIAVYDFAAEFFTEAQGEIALTRSGRSDDGEEWTGGIVLSRDGNGAVLRFVHNLLV